MLERSRIESCIKIYAKLRLSEKKKIIGRVETSGTKKLKKMRK